MESILTDLFAWFTALPVLWAYMALLVIAYGENVLPPIPGDIAVVFAGYLVGIGYLSFPVVVITATIGGTLGFMTMYGLGHWLGSRVDDPNKLTWVPNARVNRGRAWLERHGYVVVAVNRFLSGARSVIAISAGVARLEVGPTVAWATVSSLLWTVLIVYGGYALGDRWDQVGAYLEVYGRAMLMVTMVLILGYAAYRYWMGRSAPTAS
jgi:membrane protein DedA with SNARE-associated domain